MQICKGAVLMGLLFGTSAVLAEEQATGEWKIKGKIRGDNVQTSTVTKLGDADSTTTNTSEIKLVRAQFEFVGKKDKTELKIKVYGDKFGSTSTVNDALKYAFLTYNVNDMLAVSAGKLDARDFSWEWDYSSTDVYLFNRAGSYGIDNVPGAEVKAAFGTNELFVQALQGASSIANPSNPSKRLGATADHSSGGLTSSIQYRGSFVDGMVRPILTYANVRTASSKFTTTDGTSTTSYNYGNGYETHLGAGLKITAAGSTTDVEYDAVTVLKQKDSDTDHATNVTSISLQTRLPAVASITPLLKVVSDSDKKGATGNVGDVARTAFVLGAEYPLMPGIRLHAILINDSNTTKATTSKTNATVIDSKSSANTLNMGLTASL